LGVIFRRVLLPVSAIKNVARAVHRHAMRIGKARLTSDAVAGAGIARQAREGTDRAGGRDFPNGGTARVRDINRPVPVRRHAPRIAELGVVSHAVVGSRIARQAGEGAGLSGGEILPNRAVGHLGDIHIAQSVNCNSKGRPEPRRASGWRSRLPWLPGCPARVITAPDGLILRMVLLPVSAT
jgi:hypothetical protein